MQPGPDLPKRPAGMAETSPAHATHMLSLSLFTLLFAFLMALLAHSEFEDSRVSNVLASIDDTFPMAGSETLPLVLVGVAEGDARALDHYASRLQSALIARFPDAPLFGDARDGELVIRVPASSLFVREDDGRIAVTALGDVSAVLSELPSGIRLSVDARIGRADVTWLADSRSRIEAVARLADALLAAGLPPADVVSGLAGGIKHGVTLSFGLAAETPQ